MKDYFPILAIVTIVAVGGLSVLVLDSGTGMAATPKSQIGTPVNLGPICQQLEKDAIYLIDMYKDEGCGQWATLTKLICPKPAKSGYIFQMIPNQQEDPEGFNQYVACTGLISAISIKIEELEDKSGNSVCKDILDNLRDPYDCPRIIVPTPRSTGGGRSSIISKIS